MLPDAPGMLRRCASASRLEALLSLCVAEVIGAKAAEVPVSAAAPRSKKRRRGGGLEAKPLGQPWWPRDVLRAHGLRDHRRLAGDGHIE